MPRQFKGRVVAFTSCDRRWIGLKVYEFSMKRVRKTPISWFSTIMISGYDRPRSCNAIKLPKRCLTLIRGFLGPSRASLLENKSKINTSDFTVGTLEMKIICADRVPAGLSYDTNSNGICQNEGKYAALNKNICQFWDHHRASSPEKTKAQRHIQMT